MWAFRSIRGVFGGRSYEASGIVLVPDFQAKGIGSLLLQHFTNELKPEYLTGYTRNPAFLRAMQSTGRPVYPLDTPAYLQQIAIQMDDASQGYDAIYHRGRYGNAGLYGGSDPACRLLGELSLRDRFSELQDIATALVVVAGKTRL